MSSPYLPSRPGGARTGLCHRRATSCLASLLSASAVLFLVAAVPPSATAAAPATPMVNLGTASVYAVLSGASVGNTVSAPRTPHTTLRGSLGVKASTQPTDFPPGV